ncbi:hypothetical protein CFR75_16445 [Komagataeibacter xylinus]|uniref:Glycosyl transferase family 1 domain-containing protein n=2 Tax=Komagataeibacter xylinus TaxID=28448 RepID=A0A318PE08_KOMXY|nr:glycosyltransferase [Komagataeibacter xylinus]PYD55460.1 hypothetical protein CFR75_16445 [Komagataeibacter xylinus]GBQ70951.1 hypothetical protein AA15237_0974 [Komagataeibacter xylinus NBRC 15237]
MPDIMFVLPVRGGSGGAHSVMQEVTALRNIGINARVLVNEQNVASFKAVYSRFEWTKEGVISFSGPRHLGEIAKNADVVVATTNTSVHSVAEAIRETKAKFRTAYYVQDYEPLFYEAGTINHRLAVSSFGILQNCTYFAKTRWLCDIVHATHGHDVRRVVPSIDHSIYFPCRPDLAEVPVVTAMIRPPTPRRAPRRTAALLARITSGEFGPMRVRAFGASQEDLHEHGLVLPDMVEVAGILNQTDVSELLRETDFFIDLSDYQAFGRTAAEAMACGAITIAPVLGGASDFIDNGINSFLVNTGNPTEITATLNRMFSMSDKEKNTMRYAAMEAVAGYTPVRAAISELHALGFI